MKFVVFDDCGYRRYHLWRQLISWSLDDYAPANSSLSHLMM
jgi:hypothetical protein